MASEDLSVFGAIDDEKHGVTLHLNEVLSVKA